jgi:selenocysteine-specific elongation factor
MALIVGTAGHVDHGKTWLVRALTGVDTDRLAEERERGISIALGYAPLTLPGGRRLSLVDVPGHERFVRTMVAGATGIDLFLLVVDAAEGARAQTHEHLAVLRILGVERGVVAVTKADAVDAETLALAVSEARELVPYAEVVAVSARTGLGLDELRAALARAAGGVPQRTTDAATRLYVDRIFTLRGVGTVATGTLWAGTLAPGDRLVAEPRGLPVRVRGVQVHGDDVDRAEAGQRVAVSLPGIERSQLARGDALVHAGAYPASHRLDVVLHEVEPVAHGARLTLHHGTSQTAAHVVRIGERYAQLRLAAPVVAARGDRFVLRGHTTVAGGIVLHPAPPRGRHPERLATLELGDAGEIVRAFWTEPVRVETIVASGLLRPAEVEGALEGWPRSDGWALPQDWLERTRADALSRLEQRRRDVPLDPGLSPAELLGGAEWVPAVVPLLGVETVGGRLVAPGAAPSAAGRSEEIDSLEAELAEAGPRATRVDDARLAAHLEAEGRLVRVGDGQAVSAAAYAQAREVAVEECGRAGELTLARFRDLLGTGRRDAQLLLERLDADGVTRRRGDVRVLRRR